jgi:hypothetical protein
VDVVEGLAIQAIERRCDELVAWFEFPAETRTKGLTIREIEMAVAGRFSTEIANGELVVSLEAPTVECVVVSPEQIRSIFDLWSELAINAFKYSGRRPVRLRVREWSSNGLVGLRFSSYGGALQRGSQVITGEPKKLDEITLATGKSGLAKVAAISAAFIGEKTNLWIEQRRASFHVFVALWKMG